MNGSALGEVQTFAGDVVDPELAKRMGDLAALADARRAEAFLAEGMDLVEPTKIIPGGQTLHDALTMEGN